MYFLPKFPQYSTSILPVLISRLWPKLKKSIQKSKKSRIELSTVTQDIDYLKKGTQRYVLSFVNPII